MPRILIITGEASGDLHGANLARALKEADPLLSIVGIGGARMRAAGVELIPDVAQLDIIGLIGPTAVKAIIQRVMRIRQVIRAESWDLIVLIDNPGLNFHFARIAKAAGRRVLYYIAPQIWAWRPRRIRWIQRRVDHVVVILPFEAELYHRAGVRCTFVGHPLLDEVAPSYDRTELRKRFDLRRTGLSSDYCRAAGKGRSDRCCRSCWRRRPVCRPVNPPYNLSLPRRRPFPMRSSKSVSRRAVCRSVWCMARPAK
jgi:lipid-A-disaccharide synthase